MNSFPHSTGYMGHAELRRMIETYSPRDAYGNEHCEKCWQSPIPYNLTTHDRAHRSWREVEPGLRTMGMTTNWKATQVEIVMSKVASMDENRLTAFELLNTYDAETHLIRVPINSNLFAGGDGYKSFWRVYTKQDPPPENCISCSMPGYVEVHRSMILRIAIANQEVDTTFRFADEEPEDTEGYSSESDVEYGDDEDQIVL